MVIDQNKVLSVRQTHSSEKTHRNSEFFSILNTLLYKPEYLIHQCNIAICFISATVLLRDTTSKTELFLH